MSDIANCNSWKVEESYIWTNARKILMILLVLEFRDFEGFIFVAQSVPLNSMSSDFLLISLKHS